MSITVTGRRMAITDSLRSYAEEKVSNSLKSIDADPIKCEVVLMKEKNPANPLPAVCEITVQIKGKIVRTQVNEEDMYAAIDVASAKLARQIRKYRNRIVDKRIRATEKIVDYAHEDAHPESDLDLDMIMDDLNKEKDEIVRVKEIEYKPLTQEEALIQIDLIGHDFFVYTDRDTNQVNVIYRREHGGYGLLKPKED
ncbi:MAG: ribosome-associated translation inhibitor RaiA [Eggerthellaceae bacterium]|nr:ribosome-associated translation inhibitor RaiA [Eggerthellaceae bacterium]